MNRPAAGLTQKDTRLLEAGIRQLGLVADAALVERLEKFVAALVKWNKAYNLTAIRDPALMVPLHLLDSLAIAPYLSVSDQAGPTRVLDIGSGAGLPGIPLALFYPQLEFVLLDSNGKKTRFLQQMKIELGLANVTVAHARVEDYRGHFDQILCRAFASLETIASTTAHLLAAGGEVLAMKGKAEAPGWHSETMTIHAAHPIQVPGIEAERHLYVLQPALDAQQRPGCLTQGGN